MSPTLEDLQAALLSLHEELNRVKSRLRELERVVVIGTDDQGRRSTLIECTEVALQRHDDTGTAGLRLSLDDAGHGVIQLCMNSNGRTTMELGLEEDGSPLVSLMGSDGELRAQMFVTEDCGGLSTHGPGGRAGTLTRAQPRGGSVAVLQADGAARGVLMHFDTMEKEDGTTAAEHTEVIFGDGHGHTSLKMSADEQGCLLTMGGSDRQDSAVLGTRGGGAIFILRSAEEQNNITLMAMDEMAQVSVNEGGPRGEGFSTRMSASRQTGSSVTVHGQQGEKAVELTAIDQASCLSLHDLEGEPRVLLTHHHESHSVLSMRATGEEDGLRAITSAEVSSLELASPAEPETKIISAVTSTHPVVIVQKKKQPLAMFGESENGGTFCAYGSGPQNTGMASISGGTHAGSLVLATQDGTPQLSMDATDQGGRLTMHNDLGFPRVYLGVAQEAGGLHLNHLGRLSLQAIASPGGGHITAFDAEGRVSGTLPDDDDTPPDWGTLPDSF